MSDTLILDKAANGHVWLHTESRRKAWKVSILLMFRYGFWRWGVWIPGVTDEAIYPDFRRGALRIHSGWDNWVGHDFLAANKQSDVFLTSFARRHFPDCRKSGDVT